MVELMVPAFQKRHINGNWRWEDVVVDKCEQRIHQTMRMLKIEISGGLASVEDEIDHVIDWRETSVVRKPFYVSSHYKEI